MKNKNIVVSSSSATSDQSLVGQNRSANDSGDFNSDQMKEYDMCQDYIDDKMNSNNNNESPSEKLAASQVPKIPQHIQMHKNKVPNQKSFLIQNKHKPISQNQKSPPKR